ncbi:MAG: UbiA family prenyltransferase [Candidatus Omnitrophica bacterium]|nr:UbiA family prenyltransferase [Candidatus Omnitrophota bacterium]
MWTRVKIFLRLIKFEHTVFALPFAYLGMILARKSLPSPGVFFWVTAAMGGARTAGMLLNRIIDRPIDAKNPRTQDRPTVTGEFSLRNAWLATGAALLVFFISVKMLNDLCFKLSFVALFLLTTYHTVKRFSFLCHFALGLVLAAAPLGGWIAVTGHFAWTPVILSLAVLFWVAGFDVIYSLQDVDFDRMHGLHSIPARFGEKAALRVSEYSHLATVFFLALFGCVAGLGVLYWAGVLAVAILLKAEHLLVPEDNFSRIHTAFFTINGWIGILLLIFTFLEIY